MLAKENQPLFEGAVDFKLSVCVRLLSYKSNLNIPNQCLDAFTKLLLDLTSPNMSLPKIYYDAKKLVSKLGYEAKKIDCCVSGCMLFYDNDSGKKDAALLECKFCHKPRYHPIHQGSRRKKPIIAKSMFYLSIIQRLQRIFASMQTAPHLMVKPGSTLIVNIQPLPLIHAMCDLVYVQMDLTCIFRLHLHHILVGL